MIIALTGHRPKSLPCKYNEQDLWLLNVLVKLGQAMDIVKPRLILSGMAIGWDMWATELAISKKIPVHAYIPFYGQELKWPPRTQQRYKNLMAKVEYTKVIASSYSSQAMKDRNIELISACDEVWALYSGDRSSGTGHAIGVAQIQNKQVVNFYE